MTAKYPPYVNSTGLVSQILNKIKSAQTPPRFSQDFLKTVLGFGSGSAMAFIPLLKRIGFLGSDGAPTEIYKRFRNPEESKYAMAEAIKIGYQELFTKNEYAYKLEKAQLSNLALELTGLEKGNAIVSAIVGTFTALKSFADFSKEKTAAISDKETLLKPEEDPLSLQPSQYSNGLGMNLSYTINLNLPETTDINVFNAIFKSLKENLLKK